MSTASGEESEDVAMESPAPNNKIVPSFGSFTKAERIQQLNDIDKSITQLLQSAGLAIKTLTSCQIDATDAVESPENPPQTFTDATNTYLKALHSVDVRLKRQIYGLNEARIIAMDKRSPDRLEGQNIDGARAAVDKVTLDVGWLNSRGGKVGRDMEAELWAKTRAFLDAMEAENNNQTGAKVEDDVEDENMKD